MTVEPVEALRKWFERNSKIISSAKLPETGQCLPHKRERQSKKPATVSIARRRGIS